MLFLVKTLTTWIWIERRVHVLRCGDQVCPLFSGWSKRGTFCYRLSVETLTWQNAQDQCSRYDFFCACRCACVCVCACVIVRGVFVKRGIHSFVGENERACNDKSVCNTRGETRQQGSSSQNFELPSQLTSHSVFGHLHPILRPPKVPEQPSQLFPGCHSV